MDNNTTWTPSPDDNLKGLTNQNVINEIEAKGIATAELFIFKLNIDVVISTTLVLEVHKIAFAELYEWAGKWRTTFVTVGQLIPPQPNQVLNLMYQFIDNLNYKILIANSLQDYVSILVFAHYEFIRIHPFNNGNGRTGRLLVNLLALKFGYRPITLYHREGDIRKSYIKAMQMGDKGDFGLLSELITKELIPF